MSWLSEILKRWRILPAFTEDDILNAENENALWNVQHGKADLDAANEKQKTSTRNLKRVMHEARIRVNAFAEFERQIRASVKPPVTAHKRDIAP